MTVLNAAIPPILQDAPSRPAAPVPYVSHPDGKVYRLVPISERHIELKTQLYDVVTANYFVELQWRNPDNSQGHDTVAQGVIDNKTKLLNLSNKNAPVSAANVTEIMAYLKYQAEHTQRVDASSQLGWQGGTFVLPGGSMRVIGIEEEPWQPQGDKEAFREALKKLIGWGQTPALMAMFASAAAPAVRLAKLNRNPILSFSSTSGTGKSTCTAAALSLWTTTEKGRTLYSDDATVSGIIARAQKYDSLPLNIDDVQNKSGEERNKLLYALATGTEKARAAQAGEALDTKTWRGIVFLTSEESVLTETAGSGAVNRVIEFADAPLGRDKTAEGLERASILEHIAKYHHASLRDELLALYGDGSGVASKVAGYIKLARELGAASDAAESIGLICYGAEHIGTLAGHAIELNEVVDYLIQHTAQTRAVGSKAQRVFSKLRDFLASLDDGGAEISYKGDVIAARQSGYLHVHVNHHRVKSELGEPNGLRQYFDDWRKAGVIRTKVTNDNTHHYDFSVRLKGRSSGPKWPGFLFDFHAPQPVSDEPDEAVVQNAMSTPYPPASSVNDALMQ